MMPGLQSSLFTGPYQYLPVINIQAFMGCYTSYTNSQFKDLGIGFAEFYIAGSNKSIVEPLQFKMLYAIMMQLFGFVVE